MLCSHLGNAYSILIRLSDVLISMQTFHLAIFIDRYKPYMIIVREDGWFYSFYNLIYSESDIIFFLLITSNTNHTPYKIKHLYKSFLYSVWWNGTMKILYMVVDSAPPFHSDVNNWLKSTINKRERKPKGQQEWTIQRHWQHWVHNIQEEYKHKM